MRSILIDWLFEVTSEFMMKRDTTYTAINIVNRYLENKSDTSK